MLKIKCFSVLLVVALVSCQGQEFKPLQERLIGLNVDSIIGAEYQESEMPAIAVGVFDAETALSWHKGVRSLTDKVPTSRDDRFHLGSCTKAITSIITARLIDRGLIDWDTRILEVFPDWEKSSRPDYQDKTLADLLSHRAGIQPFTSGLQLRLVPDSVAASSLSERRVNFSRWLLTLAYYTENKKYAYSNAGYTIATAMIEQVSGMTWEELVRTEFFEVLGLHGSFGWPHLEGDDQPLGHIAPQAWNIPSKEKLVPLPESLNYNLDYIRPAGDISMSIGDCTKYLQEIVRALYGESDYLSEEQYDHLFYARELYAMGWAHPITDGRQYITHNGSAGTFFCRILISKDSKSGVVILANSSSPSAQNAINAITDQITQHLEKN